MEHCTIPDVVAWIRGNEQHPGLTGIVRFFQGTNGVVVEAEIFGLPMSETGFFAFHIHEGRSCKGSGFSDSGSHYNPGEKVHPMHSGDLPPLLAGHGKAYMKVFTDRFLIEEIIGRTVILHGDPDDFRSQPSGNAGMKIACGVIQRVK